MKKIIEYNQITILSFCFLLCLLIYMFNSNLSSVNPEIEKLWKDDNSVVVTLYLKDSP